MFASALRGNILEPYVSIDSGRRRMEHMHEAGTVDLAV
jgi:hypothetical protein